MDNNIKQKILLEIEKKSSLFKRKSEIQYLIRCPICGDSSNVHDAHCYIKCSNDPTEPIMYNCFKCNSSGRINKYFLSKLNIDINSFNIDEIKVFNKINKGIKNKLNIIEEPPILNSMQIKYIEQRLGDGFTLEDYSKFKILWNIEKFKSIISDNRIKNTLPSNKDSISFISNDKCLLLTRFFIDEYGWKKTPLIRSNTNSIYTIKSNVDLFTNDTIEIHIAEGIFDILSAYKNFTSSENSIHIATLGSNYISGIKYAISRGFVGSNINIKIYMDNNIDLKKLKYSLKEYKWLFGNITIYVNSIGIDIGVKVDKINLIKYKV